MDQLLLLARFEKQTQTLKLENVYLNALFLDTSFVILLVYNLKINVSTEFSQDYYLKTDRYLFSIIINNLISNAVKYSNLNDDLND